MSSMSTVLAPAEALPGSAHGPSARLVEIFSSIQGEAELIGVRQIFIRFFGCNIRCTWCDSPETLTAPPGRFPPARIEQRPGKGDWREEPNPVELERLLAEVERLNVAPHHSVSLTGGEPLLHARFLEALLPRLQQMGIRSYLETNGLLPRHFQRVVKGVDWVAMDLKPPSCTGDPTPGWLERHREFLEVWQSARPRPHLMFKLVTGAGADSDEMKAAFALAAELAPEASLTLQPVTPFGNVTQAPAMDEMLLWHERASRVIADVRLLPQLHKLMGVL